MGQFEPDATRYFGHAGEQVGFDVAVDDVIRQVTGELTQHRIERGAVPQVGTFKCWSLPRQVGRRNGCRDHGWSSGPRQ